MEAEDFEYLSLTERGNMVWREGVLLGSIIFFRYKIKLYCLHNHYIEVYLNSRTNTIEKITIAHAEDLAKFVSNIDLNDLSNNTDSQSD